MYHRLTISNFVLTQVPAGQQAGEPHCVFKPTTKKKHCAFLGRKSWILDTPGSLGPSVEVKTANTLCGLFFRLNKKWKLKDSVPFSDSESGRSGYKQTLILSIGYSRPPWLRLSASRKRDFCKTNSNNQQHTQPATHIISIYFLSAMFFLIPKLVALNRLVWTLDLQHLAL